MEKDFLANKVTKYFLISEVTFFFFTLILLFSKIILGAIFLTALAFVVFIVVFLWLFHRYSSFPAVSEKKRLKNDLLALQAKIKSETGKLSESKKNKSRLFEDEKKSID